mgnify:CR=1 FL=1
MPSTRCYLWVLFLEVILLLFNLPVSDLNQIRHTESFLNLLLTCFYIIVKRIVEVFCHVFAEVTELKMFVFVKNMNFTSCRWFVYQSSLEFFLCFLSLFLYARCNSFNAANHILLKNTSYCRLSLNYFLVMNCCFICDFFDEISGKKIC